MASVLDGIGDEIKELLDQEVRMGIVLGLDYFDSLNLRQLATFVNKTEPTTYTHVKKLLKIGLIELDSTKVDQRGKFYKLSEKGSHVLTNSELDTENMENEQFNPDVLRYLAKGLRSISILASNIGNLVANSIEEDPDLYIKKIKQRNKTPFNLSATLTDVKFKTKDQMKRYNEAIDALIKVVEKIDKESEELELEDDLEKNVQVLHILSVPLYKFTPND